jgi:mannose-6-phosphate isomerase-like protein (cupin superfamily)
VSARRSGPPEIVRVPKPWGYEVVWARTDRYVGKILHVRAGESLSLQYHRVKEETIRLLAGTLDLEVGAEGEPMRRVRLAPGDGWHVPPGLRHRMTAVEDCDILEVSTPELDDVVRLEDRYGRVK